MNIPSMRKPLSVLALAALLATSSPALAAPTAGSLIKRDGDATVYYLGSDGKRYVFPNAKTYGSWYAGFSGVRTVSSAEMSSITIGGNVTYRPGARLVKVVSDPRTYAVSRGGTLRHVVSEAVAAATFGSGWATLVEDLPDAFFADYRLGEPISNAASYDRAAELAAAADIGRDKGLTSGPSIPTPPPPSGSGPRVGSCAVFPADNPWNTDISNAPVHPDSARYIASIGLTKNLHPDFGSNPGYGIPFDVVGAGQAKVPIRFTAYGDESDPGPYPIPPDATTEHGGDNHVLVVDRDACVLYELFGAKRAGNGWDAQSGAVFDLKSNALRPDGWTSADAAGLPIFPGLVRYDEVKAGRIAHALRFTASPTQQAYIAPATHAAGGSDRSTPPMGLRVRLKKDYDLSRFSGDARVILEAMKTYGMILADNGSDWYVQGEMGAPWNDDALASLKSVPGSAFEAVSTGPIVRP